MFNVDRRFSWYSVVIVLAVAAFLVVSDARTFDQSEISGQPPGLEPTVAPADATPTAQPTVAPAAAEPDEAKWVNGELVAPLPRDPTLRRQALDQAAATAMARPTTGGVTHDIGGSGGTATLGGTRSTTDRLPAITPYVPADVRNGNVTWNLKLPDQFVADPDLVRGVDPATGKPLAQAIQDKRLAAALAPALTQSWEGIAQTSLRPPDPDVSAGPSHVIAVVNARFAIYDKCGNNLYENDIAAFVGDAVNFYFDPKVIYDVWDGRWFITCCVRNNATQQSWVLLLFSDDSDPIGAWNWYHLDFTVDGGTPTAFWADYQDIGTSPDGIHITANQFDWSSPPIFQYAKIRNLDKADVLDLGGICWWDFWSLTNPGDGSLAFSLRACDMNSWPGDYLFINSVSYGAAFLTVWRLNGPPCAPVSLTSFNFPVALYDDPPPMQQPDGTFVDCGDARLLNAAYAFGDIWTGQALRHNWGEPVDRSIIRAYQVQPFLATVDFQTGLGVSGYYLAYPAVDFDENFNGIVTSSWGGPGDFGGSVYIDLANGGPWGGGLNYLAAGLTNYNDLVNAGTAADPFRWGDYYGCDLDPFDGNTLWFYGQYTATATTWGTRVGATSPAGPGFINVTPFPGLVSGGFVGGPFNPNSVAYLVENTGNAAFTWTLSGVDFWNTASATTGQLAPLGATIVNVSINAGANAFGAGVYTDNYTFEDCYSNISAGRSTVLHVGVPGDCDGASLALTPPTPPTDFGADGATNERGVYVTAIKDFELCAIGYKLQHATLPQTLTARVYAANGTTRGALLAANSIASTQLVDMTQFVPINYTLQACQDYEIVMVVPAGTAWEWWNEFGIAEPFDVGGAIRVRDGSANGNPGNFALPHFELIGSSPGAAQVTDLAGPGAPPNASTNQNQERGIFIKVLDTAQMCSFGWNADLDAGETLTARVYEAVGNVRGALIASGTYVVPGPGMQWHDIPINVQLEEGKDYDLAIQFGLTNQWMWWSDFAVAPYTRDIFQVVDAEFGGDPSNSAIMHFRAGWDEKTGGAPFDLKKITDVFPPPNSTSQDFSDYGAYVTSLIAQQVYSVGWMADVPAGQPITARVYEAVGVVRGALVSEGTVYSSGSGLRFHDVPVAVEMLLGSDYDISIEWQGVDEWRWWWDTSGVPYTINGVIQVRDGEAFGGDAGWGAVPHMRMYACDEVLTPVAYDPPARTPMFLAVPAPNPIVSSSRLDFALEEAGPVSIVIYDVAGRRVATLLEGQRPKGWSSIDIDSSNMASGVYFLKMQTKMRSLSRKFVVTH